MKNLVLFSVLVCLFSSCMTTANFQKKIDFATEEIQFEESAEDWLLVTTDKVHPANNKYGETHRLFLPLIVYWGWRSKMDCELSLDFRVNCVKAAIYKAAEELQLKRHLRGNSVEIKLEELPGVFQYRVGGGISILSLFTIPFQKQNIQPQNKKLEYNYSILYDKTIRRKGNGIVSNKEKFLTKMFSGQYVLTERYLLEYQKEMDRMGLKIVGGLIDEMKRAGEWQ